MVTGIFQPCEVCALGKAKKRSVSKTANTQSNLPGEQLFIDVSLPVAISLVGRKHWLLIVDDFTNYTLCYFRKEKVKQPDKGNKFIKRVEGKT